MTLEISATSLAVVLCIAPVGHRVGTAAVWGVKRVVMYWFVGPAEGTRVCIVPVSALFLFQNIHPYDIVVVLCLARPQVHGIIVASTTPGGLEAVYSMNCIGVRVPTNIIAS